MSMEGESLRVEIRANAPGKPCRLLSYIGGVGTHRQKCEEEAAAGYPAFRRN